MSEHFGWRVADLAGRMVAELLGIRFDAQVDVARRDQALHALAEAAQSPPPGK
jgi:hypothetical protein